MSRQVYFRRTDMIGYFIGFLWVSLFSFTMYCAGDGLWDVVLLPFIYLMIVTGYSFGSRHRTKEDSVISRNKFVVLLILNATTFALFFLYISFHASNEIIHMLNLIFLICASGVTFIYLRKRYQIEIQEGVGSL